MYKGKTGKEKKKICKTNHDVGKEQGKDVNEN